MFRGKDLEYGKCLINVSCGYVDLEGFGDFGERISWDELIIVGF